MALNPIAFTERVVGREPHEVRHVATSETLADPEGSDEPAKEFARCDSRRPLVMAPSPRPVR